MSASSLSMLDPRVYTVAWIAPLEIEARAALHMLDTRHRGRFPVGRGEDHVFHAGEMGGHNMVIATLPAGQEYGTGSAATLASHLKRCFPNLWFGLLVGVAAGLPDLARHPPRDIRLGDVLVGLPEGDSAGLVAYDLGKETNEGFRPLRYGYALAMTEPIVRSAIGSIKIEAPNEAPLFLPFFESIREKEHANGNFDDPGQDRDVLYSHEANVAAEPVERASRPPSERTRVWYGSIGSGDKLLRNSKKRDELRDKYNVIGLEMEAAGTMNRIPVGVIRGVCDYGDHHKNKEWQPYAAAMAAAYAKAIIYQIVPDSHVPQSHDVRAIPADDTSKSGIDAFKAQKTEDDLKNGQAESRALMMALEEARVECEIAISQARKTEDKLRDRDSQFEALQKAFSSFRNQSENHSTHQISDSELSDEVIRLRHLITKFACQYFETLTLPKRMNFALPKTPGDNQLPPYERFNLGRDEFAELMRSTPLRRLAAVQALIWAILCEMVFEKFAWTHEAAGGAIRDLEKFLDPDINITLSQDQLQARRRWYSWRANTSIVIQESIQSEPQQDIQKRSGDKISKYLEDILEKFVEKRTQIIVDLREIVREAMELDKLMSKQVTGLTWTSRRSQLRDRYSPEHMELDVRSQGELEMVKVEDCLIVNPGLERRGKPTGQPFDQLTVLLKVKIFDMYI